MSNKSPNLVKLPSILSLKTNKSDLNNTRLICIYKFIYLMLQMSFVLLNAKLKLWTLITLFERAFLVRHSTTKNSKTKSKCSTATYQTALWEKSRLQSQKILGSIFFVLAVWNGSNRWTNERTNERTTTNPVVLGSAPPTFVPHPHRTRPAAKSTHYFTFLATIFLFRHGIRLYECSEMKIKSASCTRFNLNVAQNILKQTPHLWNV